MALSKLGTTEMMRADYFYPLNQSYLLFEQPGQENKFSRLVKIELYSTLHRTVHQSDDGLIERRSVE